MADFVLDTSAVMAAIQDEPGAARVRSASGVSAMSTVNLTETIARLVDLNYDDAEIRELLDGYLFSVVSYDEEQSWLAGLMRRQTRHLGLSLGDRACLALAASLSVPVLTADRAWAGLDVGVEVRLIR